MLMIRRKGTFFLGIFIFVIPFLGLPTFWKTLLVTISGAILVLSSIKISIPNKRPVKAKPRRGKTPNMTVEEISPVVDNFSSPDNRGNFSE